jgi:hypothetical protein
MTKSVKFFCYDCGIEIWEDLDGFTKQSVTVAMIEEAKPRCSNCTTKLLKRTESKSYSNLDAACEESAEANNAEVNARQEVIEKN